MERGEILFASKTYSGPIPPPDDLAKYDGIFPGCAQRIMAMAEAQAEHRRGLEARVVDANCLSQRRGQALGFILAAIALGGSFGLIFVGKEATGIGLIVAEVAALLGVFMYGRSQQRRERVEKEEVLHRARFLGRTR